ncbi:hypothetical protein CEXT_386511 [Caerostris extrusa]|uniref:Uncharacterized protein n=1 Tax=Caerostris extrusa TaxID=172846 RepID=A0AAV4SIJ3_CAEEX|nr:hypothetical protein CEXT_386511 [Caerostris extrusa]
MAISPTKEQSFDARATFDKFTEEAGNKGKLYWKMQKNGMKRPILQRNLKNPLMNSVNYSNKSKGESGMTFEQFKEFIEKFAKDVQFEVKEVINKLMASQEKK